MPAIRGAKSKTKTRRYKRDIDQVQEDLISHKHLKAYKDTKATEDLPDFGRWYCLECARWFEAEANLLSHKRGKTHKRRVKSLAAKPYSQKEADSAAGLFNDEKDHHK